MPEYKQFGEKMEKASRMTRKRDRNDVFIKNKKASKVARELRRAARLAKLEEEEIKIGGTD